MPAHEATAPVPSDDDAHEAVHEVEAREVDRPTSGSGGSGGGAGDGGPGATGALAWAREHWRGVVAGAIVAIAAFAAFSGPGGGGDGGSGDGGGSGGATSTVESGTADPGAGGSGGLDAPPSDGEGGNDGGEAGSEGTDPSSDTEEPEGPTTTLTPPDIDTSRPAIDLNVPPPPGDAVEVARWWGATYTAYIGAEPPAQLVTRLDEWTEQSLLDELAALPPAASYDPPVALGGVSAQDLPTPAGDSSGDRHERVSVETDFALVIYDLTLVDAGGRWLVSEATRL